MSQQGTRAFYQITETIKNQLLEDVNVNTVTFGNITDIDLSKQTMFPLSHIVVNNVSFPNNTVSFNISVLSMDIVDQSKEREIDIFVVNTAKANYYINILGFKDLHIAYKTKLNLDLKISHQLHQ